jgi:hypothetical protein
VALRLEDFILLHNLKRDQLYLRLQCRQMSTHLLLRVAHLVDSMRWVIAM